jgi:Putative DNA-binding domain
MTRKPPTPLSLAELGAAIAADEAALVRSAWCGDVNDTWRLRLLEIVARAVPDGVPLQRWAYPQTSLSAIAVTGDELAGWLQNGTVVVDGREHDLGQLGRVNWERRESHARTGYQPIEWPSYEVQLGQLQTNEPQRPLLSDTGAPSFASFYNAAACFFGLGDAAITPGGSVPSSALFRWVDTRARINSVEITEDELRVAVEGAALDGVIVELASDAPGNAERLNTSDRTATVTFPLPEGLPPGAWVVVRAGSEWLDRRFLTWPWSRGQEPGVTAEVQPKTRVDAYIAARENDAVEFKQEIPEQDSTKAKAMKTVCAFANGSGGSLLFGITDDYEVVGLPKAKANRYVDTLAELVDAWVEPVPTYSFEVLPIEGTHMVVIELAISPGFALFGSSKPNEPRRVYVRHHSRSVPARVREIEAIVQRRPQSTGYPTY